MTKIFKWVSIVVIGVVTFAILNYLFRGILNYLPDPVLWGKFDYTISVLSYSLNLFSVINFVLGLIIFCYGICRLYGINKQNHEARDHKTRKPTKLLTEGYYSEVRHPMYGAFVLIQLGLLFSLRSLFATIIIVLVIVGQFANGIFEEKRELVKIFGDEYEAYRKKVRARFITEPMKIIFTLAGVSTVFGIMFIG